MDEPTARGTVLRRKREILRSGGWRPLPESDRPAAPPPFRGRLIIPKKTLVVDGDTECYDGKPLQ